jgi:23S rRNA (adenine2503-C2)-methyltransferase
MNNNDKSFLDLTNVEIAKVVKDLGEQPYRTDQLDHWIYKKYVQSWQEMNNLPPKFVSDIDSLYRLHPLTEIGFSGKTNDPAQKFLFQTSKKNKIESVLMFQKNRTTICVSSQSGCAVDCKFCATALMGFKENLSPGEIVDQFLHLSNRSKSRVTNVVFMGMGEPFLNYKNVSRAAEIINKKINLGARKITISTAGVVSKIYKMADDKLPYKLAISLNAPNNEIRKKIMPLTNNNPIEELIKSADYYYSKLKRFVTFEYVLLNNVNDSEECALELIDLLKNIPCKLNVIPYNEIGGKFSRPSNKSINTFIDVLKNAPFTVTVRWSKGTKIDAGCGQLAVKN